MTVERVGEGRFWEVHLESGQLVVGGLEVDLGPAPEGEIFVYADPEGNPTLEATDWLGAHISLPPRCYRMEVVGEMEMDGEPIPLLEQRPEPLNLELVRVRLYALPERVQEGWQGGEP